MKCLKCFASMLALVLLFTCLQIEAFANNQKAMVETYDVYSAKMEEYDEFEETCLRQIASIKKEGPLFTGTEEQFIQQLTSINSKIRNLENRLSALSFDSSSSAQAQKARLEADLAVLEKERDELYASKSRSSSIIAINEEIESRYGTLFGKCNGVNYRHTMGWKVVEEASCEKVGMRYYQCSKCGYYVTDEQAMKEHSFLYGVCIKCGKKDTSHRHNYVATIVPPNCTKDGYTTHTCICGDSYIDSSVPAWGHKWSIGKVVKEPTYTEKGEKLWVCSYCSEEKSETIPKLTHNPFNDVKESYYFYAPVLWAVSNNVTGGIGEGLFGPNNGCTRGQVVTFLWAAAGRPEPKSTVNPFADVTVTDYFYKAVLWAVENGITGGVGDGLFGPNNTCTRGQIVTFLWAAKGKPAPQDMANNIFSDVYDTDYFYASVLWAVENEVTGGIGNGMFGPNNTCTRGQVVTFLYKVYG